MILMDFEFGRNEFEWMLGFRFWADFLMFLGGFKLVFDVSRYGELRLTDILMDFEEFVLFIFGFFIIRISNWVFLGDLEFSW